MGTRPGRVLGVVIGAVVALAVVAAALASTRPATTWDRSSPEGALQAYLAAVLDADAAEAAGYLSTQSPCDVRDLEGANVTDTVRVDLVGTTVEGGNARVRVELTRSTGGGPLDSSYTEEHTFRLTRTDAGWRLVGSPWPLYDCAGGVK